MYMHMYMYVHVWNSSLSKLLQHNGKYHMGHVVAPREACYSDPWRPYSPFLFLEGEDGVADDYSVPDHFKPMSTFQMGIGRGRGVGVPPENHPSSWFAMIVGRKRWMLHPDIEREPVEIMSKSPDWETREVRRGCRRGRPRRDQPFGLIRAD